MVTVGMNYNVIEGKGGEFEAVFAKVLGIMKQMAGHAETHLYRDVAAPNSYLIVSEWSDKGAFDGFIQSQQFRNVADWGKSNILAGRPQHRVYGAEATPAGKCPAGAHA